MNKVYIYGAGGLGRDVMEIAEENLNLNEYKIMGFIDDNKENQKNKILGYKIYSLEEIEKNSLIAIAIGDPLIKNKIKEKLDKGNFKGIKIISKKAYISRTAKISNSVIIYPNAIIASNSIIGEDVLVCGNVSIGHDTLIGENSSISFNSSIGGFSKIGKGVYIGSGAHVRDEVEIGSGSLIGMGAVVVKNFENKKIVFGNPAQIKGDKGEKTIF